VLLVCVPRFSDSRSIVRVNMRTLACDTVTFNIGFD
jgi:hypothetical protein